MKLFERTPTGRTISSSRIRGRSPIFYSKTDKPFSHRLNSVLHSNQGRFMLATCIFCVIMIMLMIYSPASSSTSVPFPHDINKQNDKKHKNESVQMDEILNDLSAMKGVNGIDKAPKTLSNELSNLLKQVNEHPNDVNIDYIEQLLFHRNDLKKYLNGIDGILSKHKDKLNKNQNENPQITQKPKITKKIKKTKQMTTTTQQLEISQRENQATNVQIRGEIMKEFKHAWKCYKECAWGFDTLHPLSCTGSNDAFDLGLAMIDALDTMILMNSVDRDSEFESDIADIREWIATKMHFDQKKEVALFESSIRILGGLLSAYHLTNDSIYLDRSKQLGDKLMFAFDTKSGIPFASIDFTTNRAFNPSWSRTATSTSEAASVQLEFNYLSYLSGDNKYAKVARKSQKKVIAAQRKADPPLLRKFIDINSGLFSDNRISFGSRIDSSYEYYLKVPLQLGRHVETDDIWKIYLESIETAEKELFKHTAANNRLYIAEKSGGSISDQFDHLVCFMGGALVVGSEEMSDDDPLKKKHYEFGRDLTETCHSIYASTPTRLAPEIVFFSRTDKKNDFEIHARDKHNLLRPETVESIFYLWRISGDEKYRTWAYEIFSAFRKYTRIDKCGYGSINDVTVRSKDKITFKGDKMESFFLAETLKYLYLIFTDNDVVDIKKYVFNTEAHPFPRLTAKEADKLFS